MQLTVESEVQDDVEHIEAPTTTDGVASAVPNEPPSSVIEDCVADNATFAG